MNDNQLTKFFELAALSCGLLGTCCFGAGCSNYKYHSPKQGDLPNLDIGGPIPVKVHLGEWDFVGPPEPVNAQD